ncbi:MAG TPA: Clp protease N-terminal domain-containing protein [Nitrolancea sp.]|nr:Clp protease N-terminal domain-containing protein [Nitrolancea sp.]
MCVVRSNWITTGRIGGRMRKLGRRTRPCVGEDTLSPKLTARAQVAMTQAHKEAMRRGDDYIGTEHLLLGLLGEAEGIAATVLRGSGFALEATRAAVDRIIGQATNPMTEKRALKVTPRLKRVLELAGEEARDFGQRYIGTEHLLIALLREGDGVGADILLGGDLDLDHAREAVRVSLARIGQPAARSEELETSTVVMCRLDAHTLAAVDTLIEAGVRSTRSDAVAWLVQAGIEANTPLLATVQETVTEIRRLRSQAQDLARQALAHDGAR